MFVCFVVLIRVESTCHCPTMLDRSAMASSAADCSRVLELVLCSTKSWMISMFFFTSFFLFHQWWLHSNQAFKSCLVGGILSWDHLSFFWLSGALMHIGRCDENLNLLQFFQPMKWQALNIYWYAVFWLVERTV